MKKAKFLQKFSAMLLAALLTAALIPCPARAETQFDTALSRLERLESLAVSYKSEKSVSASVTELVLVYIRCGNSGYTGTLWNTLAGEPDAAFVSYVAANDADAAKLRSTGSLSLPNGEKTDFIHMFATLNMLFKGRGDLGGWLGDTCDLLRDIQSASGTADELLEAAKAKFLISGGFAKDDWIADIDAFNLYEAHSSSETWAQTLRSYFLPELTERARVSEFVRGRFGSSYTLETSTRSAYRSFVLSEYKSDFYIGVLERQRSLSDKNSQRTAACYAVADHIYDSVRADKPTAAEVSVDFENETLNVAAGVELNLSPDFSGAARSQGDAAAPGAALYARRPADKANGAFFASETFVFNVPERPETPEAPVLSAATESSLTIIAESGLEYSIDEGQSWRDDGAFSGLEAFSEYTVVSRVKASGAGFRSLASGGLTVRTERPSEGIFVYAPTGEVSFLGEAGGLVVAAAFLENGKMLKSGVGAYSEGRWYCFLPGAAGKSGVRVIIFTNLSF